MASSSPARTRQERLHRRGLRLEWFTVSWNVLAIWLVHALRTRRYPLPAPWVLGILLGGAVASFADGRVTDFLDLGVGAHRFATFNLADIFILTGVALLLLASVRVPRAPEPSPQPTSERGEAAV